VLCLSSIFFFSLPSRKKWTRHHPYRPLLSLAILDIGLALSCAEHAITLVSLSFTILVVRQGLKLAAMIFIVVGFLLVDKPRPSPSFPVEAKMSTDAPRHARSRSSFGQMPDRIRIPSRRIARNRSKTASGTTGKGLRGQIGNPLDETFRKMTTDETRDFHATKAEGQNAAVGDGKKVSFVKPAERVVFRTVSSSQNLSLVRANHDTLANGQSASLVLHLVRLFRLVTHLYRQGGPAGLANAPIRSQERFQPSAKSGRGW
jgi:hypothetical protein